MAATTVAVRAVNATTSATIMRYATMDVADAAMTVAIIAATNAATTAATTAVVDAVGYGHGGY
ncbi:hypothetical protein J3B02_000119 [Coemansia erecta]|nr:hypothetical protein J3B02_000119 [Coemansia erecta]